MDGSVTDGRSESPDFVRVERTSHQVRTLEQLQNALRHQCYPEVLCLEVAHLDDHVVRQLEAMEEWHVAASASYVVSEGTDATHVLLLRTTTDMTTTTDTPPPSEKATDPADRPTDENVPPHAVAPRLPSPKLRHQLSTTTAGAMAVLVCASWAGAASALALKVSRG